MKDSTTFFFLSHCLISLFGPITFKQNLNQVSYNLHHKRQFGGQKYLFILTLRFKYERFSLFLCLRPADVGEELEMGMLNADADKWEISRTRITLEEVIGSGSFGTVWRAVLSSGNGQPGIQFVAAKCFTR